MNVAFIVILLSAIYLLTANNPDYVMTAMLAGVGNGVSFSIKLFCIYAVWLSMYRIWEKAGIDKTLAKLLKRPVRALFPKESDKAYSFLSLNLSANLIGVGGAGTPLGIKAIENMKSKKNKIMLIVLNSTSIQLIPATVISMRAELGSNSDIILPTLLVSTITTVIAVLLVKVLVRNN